MGVAWKDRRNCRPLRGMPSNPEQIVTACRLHHIAAEGRWYHLSERPFSLVLAILSMILRLC
jgi:hypothetical protein